MSRVRTSLRPAHPDVADVAIVALHKPVWTAADVKKRGWLDVEQALADRPYTVFCGHVHRYHKFVRQGRDYYQLATTGGGSKLRGVPYGEFDHLVWVTMKKTGPIDESRNQGTQKNGESPTGGIALERPIGSHSAASPSSTTWMPTCRRGRIFETQWA